MKRLIGAASIVLFLIGIMTGGAFGESYPNGVEGIKCGSAPPPGAYYKMYNFFYNSDTMLDNEGDEIDIDFDFFMYANVHRFLWVTEYKILGADYAFNFFIPLLHKDASIGAMGYDDEGWGLGDIIVEPFVLSWHGERWDAVTAIAGFLPTGSCDPPYSPIDLGEDMWTLMFSLGGTYYLDQAKTWSASVLSRYEIHSEKSDTDIEPGDDFHFEWGVAKNLAKVWDVGLVGYCQWQVSEDKGSGAADDKDQAYGIGPEVNFFYPPWMLGVQLRSLWEFGVEGRASGRPEGYRTIFNIIKVF